MAIEFKLKNVSITDNRARVQDITGNYDATTNPGGYGTPNASRVQLPLYVIAEYKRTKGDVLQEIAPYNPISSFTYDVTLGKDGWYRFSMLRFEVYNQADLSEYQAGDVLYDTSTAKLIKVVDTLNTTIQPPELDRTTEVVDISEVSPTLYTVASEDIFYVAESSKTKLRLNTAITELIFKQVTFTDKQLIRAKDNYNLLRAVLQGAIYEYSRGNKYVAQKNIEFLNTNNYEQY